MGLIVGEAQLQEKNARPTELAVPQPASEKETRDDLEREKSEVRQSFDRRQSSNDMRALTGTAALEPVAHKDAKGRNLPKAERPPPASDLAEREAQRNIQLVVSNKLQWP